MGATRIYTEKKSQAFITHARHDSRIYNTKIY